MIVATVLLLVMLSTLLPLLFRVTILFVPKEMSARIAVRLYGIIVFYESIEIQQGMLVFSGSVDLCIRIVDINFSGGSELVKAIVVERVDMLTGICLLSSPEVLCLLYAFTSAVGHVAAFVNVDVGSTVVPSIKDTKVCLTAKLQSSLCEIGICLFRQALSPKVK